MNYDFAYSWKFLLNLAVDMLLFVMERTDKRGFLSYRYKTRLYLREVMNIRQDATVAGTPCLILEVLILSLSLFFFFFRPGSPCQ